MSRRPVRNTQAFASVAADQRSTVEMDTNNLIHFGSQIIHKFNGGGRATDAQFRTNISKHELILNGVVQREASAGEILDIAEFKGRAFEAGILPIDFAQGERVTLADQDATALGTGDITEFVHAVTIAAAIATPELDIRRIAQPATSEVRSGLFATWLRQQIDWNGGAATAREQFVGSRGRQISHIHFFSTQINGIKISRGDTVVWDLDKEESDALFRDAGYVPVTGMYTVSWEALTGRLDDALALGNQKLNFELDMAANDTFDFIVEELGAIRT